MELTGKCKEDFEKWFIGWINAHSNLKAYIQLQLDIFYSQKDSMQYGIYVDFFDSVGIRIFVGDNLCSQSWEKTYEERLSRSKFGFEIEHENYASFKYKTRQEAREQAIKKANEIYNEKTPTN